MMDRARIKEILPHREPFLFLDRVLALEPGQYGRGSLYIDPETQWLQGHFPNYPIFPGVLQTEAIAQLGAVVILSQPELRGQLPLFAELSKVRFRRQVLPGETLTMEVRIMRARGRFGVGKGWGSVEDEKALEGEFKYMLVDNDV